MLVLAWALAAAGLGKPVLPLSSDVFRHLVVFDITQSMNVADARPADAAPTRLEHAKTAVLEAATALPCGSELGLGLFTGHRTFLLLAPVEICESYAELSATVRAVDWRMAWAARSEIAKGVHSGLAIAGALGPTTSLVFITDGHEAPPLHAELRPSFAGEPGTLRGLLAGVGRLLSDAHPQARPAGQESGVLGRGRTSCRWTSSPSGAARASRKATRESMRATSRPVSRPAPNICPRCARSYLRSLASGLGIRYRRIRSAGDLKTAFQHPDFANERTSPSDIRPLLAGGALLLVAGSYVVPTRNRRANPLGAIARRQGRVTQQG